MLFETLDKDSVSVIMSFIWSKDYTKEQFNSDINYYISWHRVPDIFVKCAIRDQQLEERVPSPYRKNNPFIPRHIIHISPWSIWSPAMKRLIYWISKDECRKLRTYKRCVMRWVADVIENRKIEYYIFLHHKILKHLTPKFFRPKGNIFFQQEVLHQIASCPL
jgi:hypothetical protein